MMNKSYQQNDKNIKLAISTFGRYHLFPFAANYKRYASVMNIFYSDMRKIPEVLQPNARRFFVPFHFVHHFAKKYNLTNYISEQIIEMYDKWVSNEIKLLSANEMVNIFHGWSSFCNNSIKCAKKNGVKTIVERSCPHIQVQEIIIREELEHYGLGNDYLKNSYFSRKQKMIEEYHEADFILTCSEYSKQSFVKMGIEGDKVFVIPLGANIANNTKIDRSNRDNIFRVLCVGTDPVRKGIVYLIKAWKKLNLKNAELIIRASATKKIVDMSKGSNIIILPRVPRTKLIDLFRNADVFCLPSVDEGFGMVVLEAMSFGLPVIVSSNVGAKEIFENNKDGIVFKNRDIEDLAESLLSLYKSKEYRKYLGIRSYRIARKYSWEKYAAEVNDMYKIILNYKK